MTQSLNNTYLPPVKNVQEEKESSGSETESESEEEDDDDEEEEEEDIPERINHSMGNYMSSRPNRTAARISASEGLGSCCLTIDFFLYF